MSDISTRIQDYLNSKKPKEKVIKVDTVVLKTELEQSVDELKLAWNEFVDYFSFPILIMKWTMYIGILVLISVAISIVSLQNKCYLDYKCRIEIERVNQ